MESRLRQIIIIRRDLIDELGWSVGSVIAQAVHASISCLQKYKNDTNVVRYLDQKNIDSMTTVILQVDDQRYLENTNDSLSTMNIDYVMWKELPEDVPTAIALKPYEKAQLPLFLKSLKLFSK